MVGKGPSPSGDGETLDGMTVDPRAVAGRPEPGAVLVFSVDRPVHGVLPTRALPPRGDVVELGRDALAGFGVSDRRISRRHVECRWHEGGWTVRDLESRNGTAVDGQAITEVRTGPSALVRLGSTLVLLTDNVHPHQWQGVVVTEGVVLGATFLRTFEAIRQAASGRVLHVTGPSGAGKELAARAFHRAGPRPDAPFVALNCAAIPEGVAERLLFGARKGAYSGAVVDAVGHIQEANGGTLFLDEIGDLDLAVQAKLLRVLETQEVIPLGASRGQQVDVRFVSATHKDLREAVAHKRFREDLYYRIGRPHVMVPPLRERREEIPVIVDREVRALGLAPHVSLVECALLRVWPGNVRELLTEVQAAARASVSGDGWVRESALSPHAGVALEATPGPAEAGPPSSSRKAPKALPSRDEIVEALRAHQGRVASAARALGVHRNQLRRWLSKEQLDPTTLGGDDPSPRVRS